MHEINWINAINFIEIKMCNYRFKIIAFTIKIWNYPLRIIALTNAIKDQAKIILQCCNYLKIDNFPSPNRDGLKLPEYQQKNYRQGSED